MLQGVYKGFAGSGILKRTQKGSEGESTGSSLSSMNDMSSEILYLLDPAQGLFTLEGNTSHRALASCEKRPGVARPLALHTMLSEQPVRP